MAESSRTSHRLSGSSASVNANKLSSGFPVKDEILAFSCADANVAQFSMPQEAFSFAPAPNSIIQKFSNGDQERMIHNNIELDAKTVQGLEAMRAISLRENKAFMPSVIAMATRFLSRGRGDAKKAMELMEATEKWREGFFKNGPITDAQVQQDLKLGIVYLCGRDAGFRPIIVVRVARIPQAWAAQNCIAKRLTNILIFIMEYVMWYMLVPGRIENACVVADCEGVVGSMMGQKQAIKDVGKVMGSHYIGRICKFYIVNMPWYLRLFMPLVTARMTERQRQKMAIINDVKAMRSDFALHHLEEDLGGTRPVIKQFFPFQLQPGPFTAGYQGGPNQAAVPFYHTVLKETVEARLGRMWDPKKSRQDNIKLVFYNSTTE